MGRARSHPPPSSRAASSAVDLLPCR
ncbi:hypothetical protein LINGRAHAP2_LOCUS15585 [Linum grandiflorum]